MSYGSYHQTLEHVSGYIQILRWIRESDARYFVNVFTHIEGASRDVELTLLKSQQAVVDDFGNLVQVPA